MIRLVINGRDADVLQTETIVGEYAIAPIGDISKRVGARSIQFKLPKTSNNKAIFESSEIATSTSKIPYRNLPCRIYVDGVDMNMQFCILESVDDNYNIRMYGGNSVLFDWLKDRKLADLNLRHLNHHWKVDHIAVSKDKDYPLKYALIDYNEDSPNYGIDESDSSSWMGTLLPVVYEHYLIEKCITEGGYTLNNETENSIMFADYTPVVPFGAVTLQRDNNNEKYFGNFICTGLEFTGLQWLNVSQREVYYLNDPFQRITFQDEVKVKVRGNIRARVLALDAIFGIAELKIILQRTDSASSTGLVDVYIADTVLTDTIYHDYPFDFELTVEKAYFFYNLIAITPATFWTAVPNNYEVEYSACSFEVYEVDVTKVMPLLYEQTIDDPYCEYVTVASNLPDFTQAEFIKQYMLRTNSICTIDERNKIFSIVPYKKLKDNIGFATDWSGKLDFTNKPKVEFDLDYAQRNHLKYKDDNDVIKPIGTDKTFTIDDKTLEYEKVIIQLQYSASESVYRANHDISQIKVFKDYLFRQQSSPRNLLLRFEDFEFRYRPNRTDAIDAVTLLTDVPIGFFIDTTQEYSNGFDNDLFNQFFLFITGVIDYAKVIECEMRLTTLDIANFDPLKPVYIREFDAHFYVNKIKFEYTSRKSSVVELIKLL